MSKRKRVRERDLLTEDDRAFIADNLRLAGVVEHRKPKAKGRRPAPTDTGWITMEPARKAKRRRRPPTPRQTEPTTWFVLATTYTLLGVTLTRRGESFGFALIGLAWVMLGVGLGLLRKRGGRS